MPIYEYKCQECEEQFEKLVRGKADELEVECPKCGSHEVKKALSLFGFSAGAPSPSRGPAVSSCGST